MMDFFLPLDLPPYPFNIAYGDRVMFMGSCFSEEIGNKMKELKFDVLQNPNGVLYDPISITDALFSYIANERVEEKDLFQWNGLWHSWKHHSVFSGTDRHQVMEHIHDSVNRAHGFLKQAKVLVLSLGTAFSFQLSDGLENVANCHKVPNHRFLKTLLPAEHIKADLLSAIAALEEFNPGLKMLVTVSPVKHIKSGVVENSRSKARLIEAAHLVADQKAQVFYFPAYELVTDVLRDYRFYKEDLAHPNETAIHFVFEKFSAAFFDSATRDLMADIRKIVAAARHRAFRPESEGHQQFLARQLEAISDLESRFPSIQLSEEKAHFLSQRS